MNLLVTGGAGFIGSHFVLRHKEQSPDDLIVVLDILTYAGNKAFLDPVINRIRFVQGDIADVDLTHKLIETYQIDTIVNFAAETHVDRSIQNAVPFLHTNVLGIQGLIVVLRRHPEVRMLHISTDEVFGDQEDDEPPRKPGDPLFPSSPYAASKAAGEMLLLAAERTYGIKVAITRCTNNFGPHQAEEKFIPTVIRHALQNKPVPIYAAGRNRRDWLYVTDHCDALEVILKTSWAFDDVLPIPSGKKQKGGHTFHISADSEKENIEVAKEVLKILGKSESLLSFVPDRPGHDWRYALDSSNTRSLGWAPKVIFEEGFRKTVEWYKQRLI